MNHKYWIKIHGCRIYHHFYLFFTVNYWIAFIVSKYIQFHTLLRKKAFSISIRPFCLFFSNKFNVNLWFHLRENSIRTTGGARFCKNSNFPHFFGMRRSSRKRAKIQVIAYIEIRMGISNHYKNRAPPSRSCIIFPLGILTSCPLHGTDLIMYPFISEFSVPYSAFEVSRIIHL